MTSTPAIDPEGYLIDPTDWTEDIATSFAADEDITLENDHWIVIRFMRASYEENLVAPDARHAMKHLTKETGAGRNRMFELFPYGYVKQACRIAGMKRPRAWSTG